MQSKKELVDFYAATVVLDEKQRALETPEQPAHESSPGDYVQDIEAALRRESKGKPKPKR